MNKIVLIDESLCTGCGKCVGMCPQRILYLDKETGKCKVTDETKCDRLGGCVWTCPVNAIKIT
ncbi:MAG: 4Fe-4S binding protein [Elusimicrobia bacterium]|nr:4Fe-4S binding protein [Elusimicrobiota bacterium]